MSIKLISAVSNNFCIGKDNDLVIRNKEDLKLFKHLTLNSNVVMGRKTFESIGSKALPHRYNIILTSEPSKYTSDHQTFFCDFDFFMEFYDANLDYWIIGGAEIYEKFLSENLVDSIYLSKFAEDRVGDTYFPKQYLENFRLKYINYCNGFKQEVYERK